MSSFSVKYEDYFANEEISFYDQIDIVDFEYNKDTGDFTYPCPCGDVFQINIAEMENGETIARCFSCSLLVVIVYSIKDLEKYFIKY